MTTGVEAALAAVAHGWVVFPCEATKKPRNGWKWKQWNTTDPKRINQWFPGSTLVGIACGPSRLVVVDLDTHGTVPPPWDTIPGVVDGADVWAVIAEAHDDNFPNSWPETYTVRTPSGGWHLYFQAGSQVVGNSASKLGPMVDIRGDGGYVIAGGSETPAGRYEIIHDIEPMPIPGWLLTLAVKAVEPAGPGAAAPTRPVGRKYVQAALEAEAAAVAQAPKGQRNDQLNTSAFKIARFVADGLLSKEEMTSWLGSAAQQAGLTGSETNSTIRSALKGRQA